MHSLLHVSASPGGPASASGTVARELVAAFLALQPDSHATTVDVWGLDLPEFDATMIDAKFAVLRGTRATAVQQDRWDRATRVSETFNRADRYVISLPMWNFGVPYRLKHYIDIVTLPGQNWTWSRARGYEPLLRDRSAVLVYSSAGDFGPAAGSAAGGQAHEDYQKPFMRQWLRFVGIDVVGEVTVAPTRATPDELARTMEGAVREAKAAARRLAAPDPAASARGADAA